VYEFLADKGLRTTKSVWPLAGKEVPRIGGSTCEDPEYLRWTLNLQAQGFEIGYHLATYHTSSRDQTPSGARAISGVIRTVPAVDGQPLGVR
jgi:hypothetical protein